MNVTAANRPWLNAYPPEVPTDIDPDAYRSLVELIEECFQRFSHGPAFSCMGREWSYADIEWHSRALGAFLQGLGLERGDRVAIMLPNVPQYPVAVAAILRAGFVVVNVDTQLNPSALQHQLQDAGAKAMVVLEDFAHLLEQSRDPTRLRHVITCSMGDMLGLAKGSLVNLMARRINKRIPAYHLPGAIRFSQAIAKGAKTSLAKPSVGPDDVALLQYTSGITGLSKGAVLLHRNVIANVLQSEAWHLPVLKGVANQTRITGVCALPLHHLFAFTVHLMLHWKLGGKTVLIPDARDVPQMMDELGRHEFHVFTGINTVFNALLDHPQIDSLNWSSLRLAIGVGMPVQPTLARQWQEVTGCAICEGYGLSETSPVLSAHVVSKPTFAGTIGVPLPSTLMKCLDEDGNEVPPGEIGEIAVTGPQVMPGYWQRPDETARVLTADGWLRTGDIGVMEESGWFRLVDRKRDVITVSGFQVYPNEIEDVVEQLEGVQECAVVGVPNPPNGEAIKLVVVKSHPDLSAETVREHCRARLSAYKLPKVIEFVSDLPKTPLGKVLRRQLRDR